ncbi:unnamed protein product [Polarella glacialis]|uniref:Reverse transcriptase domain-containing protein n=1 Tax=Polarella glacialis TaxID=89957 RepID=A0A813ISX4_POLGL|nr:unnamed protein product [Polarella glacialis]
MHESVAGPPPRKSAQGLCKLGASSAQAYAGRSRSPTFQGKCPKDANRVSACRVLFSERCDSAHHYFSDTESAADGVIGERLGRAQRGDFAGLLADSGLTGQAPTSATPGGVDPATEEEAEVQKIREVLSLMKQGEISRAAQRLVSDGVAEGTDAVEAKLRDMLHCDTCPPLPAPAWVDAKLASATSLDVDAFVDTLRAAPRGGRLAAPVYDTPAFSRLTPAKKGLKGKLRPLMCGATLRRLSASALCSFDKELMAASAGEAHQFAVGTPAGIEKLGATLRTLLEAFPELAVLQFDAVSAFNNMSRETVLAKLEATAPHLLTFAALWLTRPSVAVLTKTDGSYALLPTVTSGVDQGDPLSPFLFALGLPLDEIRARLQRLLQDSPGQNEDRQVSMFAALLSYLDDLSLAVPAHLADAARTIVTEELARVGLEINADKSGVYAPFGQCPPGCVDWWGNAVRHDGLLVCGKPFDATLLDFNYDPAGDSAVFPLGSARFVCDFTEAYVNKVERFIDAVCRIPALADPGEPAVQAAILRLRYCSYQKATHLLRLLPPDATCVMSRRIDEAVLQGFAKLYQLSPGDVSEARSTLQLPTSRGWLGLRPLAPLCDAAFLASWLQCAHSVGRALRDIAPAASNWEEATLATQLRVRAAVDRLTSLYGIDAMTVCEVTWGNFAREERPKRQRILSHAIWEVLYTRWESAATPLKVQLALSASTRDGRPGAGDCAHPCDNALTRLTARADHALGCARGARNARHNLLRDLLAALIKEAGGRAQTEQMVAEYAPHVARRADVRASFGPGAPLPTGECGALLNATPDSDAAVKPAERRKRSDYAPPVNASCLLMRGNFETYAESLGLCSGGAEGGDGGGERGGVTGPTGNRTTTMAILQGCEGCAVEWKVSVMMLSGACAQLLVGPSDTMQTLQERAARAFGRQIAGLVSQAGVKLPSSASASDVGLEDGSELTAVCLSLPVLVSSKAAFAALKADGSVVTWGQADYGGDSAGVHEQLRSGVQHLCATASGAFAALKDDGSVVTWGNPDYGGDSEAVQEHLRGCVQHVCSTEGAFAALKLDGSVVVWGASTFGGDCTAVRPELQSGVQQLRSTDAAFAVVKDDGSVVAWGQADHGGDTGIVSEHLRSGVEELSSTQNAFAALKRDGSIVTWRSSRAYGDNVAVQAQLQSGSKHLYSTSVSWLGLMVLLSVVLWLFIACSFGF